MTDPTPVILAGNQALALLRSLAQWGPTTTVIVHGGCVFEFKGPFPPGEPGAGYYNLAGTFPGFHGHIRLEAITAIALEEKQHRGRDSFAFVFSNAAGDTLFKVFLGRDAAGEVFPDQLERFRTIRDSLQID